MKKMSRNNKFKGNTGEKDKRLRSTSPKPGEELNRNCSICFEQLKDPSFTENCYDLFCFTCILEWSKVNPQCPVCKKNFHIIIHKFHSFKEYEKYCQNQNGFLEIFRGLAPKMPTSRFDRMISFGLDAVKYCMLASEINENRMPSRVLIQNSFRRKIYEENLWVSPQNIDQSISPIFFRQNVNQIKKFLTWVSRELLAVNPKFAQLPVLAEVIVAFTFMYEIKGMKFKSLLGFMRPHREHFLHELYNFANSRFETIDSYDEHATYNKPGIQRILSPDGDIIPPSMDYSVQPSTSNELPRRKVKSENSDCRSEEDMNPHEETFENECEIIHENPHEEAFENECEIIDVLKPRKERNYNVILLSSDEDDDYPLKIIRKKSHSALSAPTVKACSSASSSIQSKKQKAIFLDDETSSDCLQVSQREREKKKRRCIVSSDSD